MMPMVLKKDTPLNLDEARNAVRIARWAGADVYAKDRFQKASSLLAQAEDFKTSKFGAQSLEASAREAVLTAEESRLISLKIQSEARLAKEREASAARAAASIAAAGKALTDASEAFRVNAMARTQSERTRTDPESVVQHGVRDKQTTEVSDVVAVRASAAKSDSDRQMLRSKLIVQLNTVLQTDDNARGLIASMADGFFETGQYSLNSEAREKLSRLSGIVLEYPTLKIEVEGYTDSAGTEQSNMVLSENRANAVRDFLMKQGIATSSISSTGFGEDRPVATNDTAAGRQQNRRVSLVVSGDIIEIRSNIQAKVNP
jgi:outer membrane protein OmpA-like peptidoglycan-associated protein